MEKQLETISTILKTLLNSVNLVIERAHGAPSPKSKEKDPPCDIMCRLLKASHWDKELKKAQVCPDLLFEGSKISIKKNNKILQ